MRDDKLYKQLLHDAGLKATRARINVLRFFEKEKIPLNINDIIEHIGDVDIVTVYRMMDTFVEKGIVRPVHICGSSRFFELTALPHHHHIVCKKCGMIEDINECYLSAVIKNVTKDSKKFDNIKEHTFELFGICKKCE